MFELCSSAVFNYSSRLASFRLYNVGHQPDPMILYFRHEWQVRSTIYYKYRQDGRLTGPPSSAGVPRYKLTMLPVLLNGNDDMGRLETAGCLNGRGQIVGTRLVRTGPYTDYRTAL